MNGVIHMSNPVKVLVVHRHERTLKLIADMMESRGCFPKITSSGSEGVGFAQDPEVNLVLADADIHNMTARDFVTQVKCSRPQLPVVLMVHYHGDCDSGADREINPPDLNNELDNIVILARRSALSFS